MSNDITTTTRIYHADERRHEQGGLTSDLTQPTFAHFGTLSVQPIKLCVLTSDQTETPEDFATADLVFDRVRARLIQFSNEIESELGPEWKVMVRDED